MEILFTLNKDNIERIAVEFQGKEYIYIYDKNTSVISLLMGEDLIKSYQEIFESGFEGCIECQLTNKISKGVTKDPEDLVEFDLKIPEANQIIQEINEKLNQNYPLF